MQADADRQYPLLRNPSKNCKKTLLMNYFFTALMTTLNS